MSGAPRLFDPALIAARAARAEAIAKPGADFLLNLAIEDLGHRLMAVTRVFDRAVELGSRGPAVADLLTSSGKAREVVRLAPRIGAGGPPDVVASAEALPLAPGSANLVVSLLDLQTANDLPGALVQARRALGPDGLMIAALLGGETLKELREAFAAAELEVEGGVSPRVAPFADTRDMGGLLQRAGFALPVSDVDGFTARYADVFALMADLRAMGATNPLVDRRRTPLKRATLARLAAIYQERFGAPDGRVTATFQIVWISGWAPHESQQKPLKPGSAKARLADALGTVERPAGAKIGE